MNEEITINAQSISPLKKICMTIGEIPTSYLETMSYYEMLVWFTHYLRDTVIPTINNNAEAVDELQNIVMEFQNYINNYFDNLDVQIEINEKLDKMAQDGSLTNLIKNYIDPIQEAYETQVNQRISNQDVLINQINTKVDGAVSGSPLKATSTSDMTDTTRIYVNTTDGKWYYYDGDSWEIGGTYQSSELADNSVVYSKLNNNIIGNIYKYDGTSSYPTIVFELDESYTGTDDNPIQVKLRYKYKHLNNTPANISFSGLTLNKTNHTIGNTYRTNSGQVSTRCYNFDEINQTINYTHVLDGFGIGLNTNSSTDYEFIIKDIEILINNERVNFSFNSSYAANANVTVESDKLYYLSSKDQISNEINTPINLITRFNNAILNNKYEYNYNGNYPSIYFLLPKFYLNNETIKIEYYNGVIGSLRSADIKVQYGTYNAFSDQTSSVTTYNPSKNVYNYFNEKVTIEITPSGTNYNFICIRLDQSTVQKYHLLYENVKIYINNELVPFSFLSNLSSHWEDKSSAIDYLITNKEVQDYVTNPETIQIYDSIDKSLTHEIVCWGDSLTEGGTSTGLPYPTVLNNLLGDKYTVTNLGKSGQRSGAIAFRQGGIKWTLGSGITIPASNNESVSFNIVMSDGHPINVWNGVVFDVSIDGIKGKLTTSGISNQSTAISGSFTRNVSGSSKSVASGTQIISIESDHQEELSIIWMGLNDITFSYPFQTLGPVNNASAMVDYLTPSVKRFLIISCTSVSTWTTDSQLFTAMNQLNDFYQTTFPYQYVDLEDYCVHQLIYDMGLTPTEDDLTNMENDIIPDSVTVDHIHFTGEARIYIAKFIYNELDKRGWI